MQLDCLVAAKIPKIHWLACPDLISTCYSNNRIYLGFGGICAPFYLCFIIFFSSIAYAFDPLRPTSTAVGKEKTEEELAIEEAEKAEEAERAKKAARVIVLKWKGTKADETTGSLQRNVMGAIGRTNVGFFPAHELFQGGRTIRSRTLPPSQQPGKVPDSAIAQINSLVSKTERLTFDSLNSNQWSEKAATLRDAVEKIGLSIVSNFESRCLNFTHKSVVRSTMFQDLRWAHPTMSLSAVVASTTISILLPPWRIKSPLCLKKSMMKRSEIISSPMSKN